MNVILLESHELDAQGRVTLNDRRAIHIVRVLRAQPGRRLRIGLLGGALGYGEVLEARHGHVVLQCGFDAGPPPEPPLLDLMVAMPRPKAAGRLLSAAAAFAVRRLTFIGAARVEPSYFDAHLWQPEPIRRHLIEGCEQAGWVRLPEVAVEPSFLQGVTSAVSAVPAGVRKIVGEPGTACRVRHVVRPGDGVLVAIGPDGGWVPKELERLEAEGFLRVGMTGGPLRTDTACLALMALVRDRQEG